MKNEIQLNNGDWRNATGHIDYNMTNDYMFRVVLQENNIVLKGLISSMMHIPFEEIESVEVLNPIIPGEYIDDKSYVLDILVRLNNSSMINLEMQMANQNNWTNITGFIMTSSSCACYH